MLKGKSVLITGASSGLGMHFAKLVASQEASHIGLAARRLNQLEIVKQELQPKTSSTIVACAQMDVSDTQSIIQAFDKFEKEFNRPIEVVINNAGISIPKPFLQVTTDDWDKLMNVNLKGSFFVCQEASKRMIKGGGSIINIASILGLRVGMDLSTYAISKAGVIQMTKAAALELSRYKIRVNCICPGYFKTEMNQTFFESEKGKEFIQRKMLAKRLGNVDELDGAILLLASDLSSFMTGSVITVDGGHLIGSL